MAEHSAEVRPLVQTMPDSRAFLLQTGGSARRRVIKPTGSAPTITFRVSGVPGHTHNASAVASVLCNLERTRGFNHNLTDAWGIEEVEMKTAELGDSEPVADEDERFDRAIERAVGEITLIPENCHQEIREPTRSIAEVRALVAPKDRLKTVTYVEEVGGFVNPQAPHGRHISDFPDILVDMLGQQNLSEAQIELIPDPRGGQHPDIARYTADKAKTPVSIRSHSAERNENGSGEGYHFVVLQTAGQAVGILPDFTPWYGIVPFEWDQKEKQYRSKPFTVTLTRTVEVGPKLGAEGDDLDAVLYPNEAAGPLTVTFDAMTTEVASNGYCLFIDDTTAGDTVLLGATPTNGPVYSPDIQLRSVSKPGLHTISLYDWVGPPAYRFVVGGDAALPGPPSKSVGSYFQALRNMRPTDLAADMRAEFLAFVEEGAQAHIGGDNWDLGGVNNLREPGFKFNRYFRNLNLQDRGNTFPSAGLVRNTQKGATWYPLENPFLPVQICQQVLAYDGSRVGNTGQEVVRDILAHNNGVVSQDRWRDSDIQFHMNEPAMRRVFDEDEIVPPGIEDDLDAVAQWREDVDDVKEQAQTDAEAAEQVLIDAAQALYDAQALVVATAQQAYDAAPAPNLLADLVAAQGVLQPLLQALVAAVAELNRVVGLRVPHFDNWYTPDYRYNGRVEFSISSVAGFDDLAGNNTLHAYGARTTILQKMMMVRQRIGFYKAGAVQGFHFAEGPPGTVTHTKAKSYTAFYHLLCDVEEGYGTAEPVIRASGSIQKLFDMKTYVDTDNGGEPTDWHVVDITLPPDARVGYAEAVAGGAAAEITAQNDLVAATYQDYLTMGVGNALEVLMTNPPAPAAPTNRPQLISSAAVGGGANASFLFQDLAFGFEGQRLFFFSMNNIGRKDHNHEDTKADVYYFLSEDCVTEVRQQTVGAQRMHVCTRVTKAYDWTGTLLTAANFEQQAQHSHGNMHDSVCICQMGPEFQDLWFGLNGHTTVFDAILEESRQLGPVFRSQRRISQHLCAPVLNPNARLQCSAPLNYETRHLPPELRDFVIRLGNVDWSFLPGKITMEPLTLYEFNGGNQVPAAKGSLLHLPQFREGSTTEVAEDGKFDFEVFSPYGMPSYIAVFARDTDFSKNYYTQPLVTQLSIMCNTTMKKSNTILDADVHQLYHITQRNVHPRAAYDRDAFNNRQVILLRAEDVGLLGLHTSEYQYEKRAQFRFQGTVDQLGRVTALLIFNNRGLHVHGKQLSVERLVRKNW